MGKISAFCRDFFIDRKTIQNKILFPFILFSFLAIVLVVILVVQALSQRIEKTTSKDILAYKETFQAFFREKEKQTVHYGSLLAFFRSSTPPKEQSPLHRTMDISHMDLLIKEGVKIYVEPTRFLHSGNRWQRDMVKRGLNGEEYSDLIFKNINGKMQLDFDSVAPYVRRGRADIVIVGFSLDDEYLAEIKEKIKNDLFILYNDQIIASTISQEAWKRKIEAKVTPTLISRILDGGESSVQKVYLNDKEYKVVFAPLKTNQSNKAIFGLIMSTNDLTQAKRQVIINYLAISLVIMIIVTLINYFIVKTISRPVKEMALMADSVAQGDLTRRLRINSQDELSVLADSFNNMVESLQKQREELDLTVRQLIHQEKFASLGEMAARVAHEVGNPLSIIVGYSKMLLKKCGQEEDRQLLQRVSEAALRINGLTRRLLMYSRPSAQEEDNVDINRVIEDSLAMMEHQFKEEKNFKVIRRLSPNVREITGSFERLEQVFVNLFINAFQAMPEGGTLTVSTDTTSDGRHVRIEVSDSGMGIPEENLVRIFDPFFSTKSQEEGTGLGLSITHRIITDHQGSIHAESTVGQGTTFTLLLPYSFVKSNQEQDPSGRP
jgi:signal transduction histidine kinase